MQPLFRLALAGLLALLPCPDAQATEGAQEPSGRHATTLLEQLRSAFQKEYLALGALLRVGASFQRGDGPRGTPPDGFDVDAARIRAHGALDRNVDYDLQADLIKSPALLDAKLTWRFLWGTSLAAGQFKPPMSREARADVGTLDLRERAQAVAAIAPERDRGARLAWTTTGGRLYWSAGVWNGTGPDRGNDSDGFLYLGRVLGVLYEGPEPWGLRRLEVGASGGTSHDAAVDLSRLDGGGFTLGAFRGRRDLIGLEGLARIGEIELGGEYLQALLDPATPGAPDLRAEGWYLQMKIYLSGSRMHPEAILRQDVLRPNYRTERREIWALGVNAFPSPSTRIQVVGAIGDDNPKGTLTDRSLSVAFQLGF